FYYYIEKAAYLNLRSQVLGTNDSLEAKLVNKAYHDARIKIESIIVMPEPQTEIDVQRIKIKKAVFQRVSILTWKLKYIDAKEGNSKKGSFPGSTYNKSVFDSKIPLLGSLFERRQ
ncbi:MAG: hypothetical protein Q8K60_04120, partial [Parachlamydiaceae bacterium]|nr:hypothetical protein [Parachlamydiaceae bacterium]